MDNINCGNEFIKKLLKNLMIDYPDFNPEHPVLNNLGEKTEVNYIIKDKGTVKGDCEFIGIYNREINYFITSRYASDSSIINCDYIDADEKIPIQCYECVVYIDMVAFKAYDDYLSERVGDILIAYAANYFNTCKILENFLFVKKGGDEFHGYYMSTPQCSEFDIELDPLNNDQTLVKEKIEDPFYNATNNFAENQITIYVPRSQEGVYDVEYNDHKPNVVIGIPLHKFRFKLKGMSFRYGYGKDPEAAWKMANIKKQILNAGEENRGEFDPQVHISLFGDTNANVDEWIPIGEHIILYFAEGDSTIKAMNEIKGDIEEDEKVREKAVKILRKKLNIKDDKVSLFYDDQLKAFFIAIKCDDSTLELKNKKRRDCLKKICDTLVLYENDGKLTDKNLNDICTLSNQSLFDYKEIQDEFKYKKDLKIIKQQYDNSKIEKEEYINELKNLQIKYSEYLNLPKNKSDANDLLERIKSL